MTLSSRLRSLRRRKGLSQADLAALLHISRMTYTQYESGNREPGLQALTDLAAFYQVSTDYLLGRSAIPSLPALSAEEAVLLSRLDSLSVSRREQVFRTLANAAGEELLEHAVIRKGFTGSSCYMSEYLPTAFRGERK